MYNPLSPHGVAALQLLMNAPEYPAHFIQLTDRSFNGGKDVPYGVGLAFPELTRYGFASERSGWYVPTVSGKRLHQFLTQQTLVKK